MPGSPHVNYEPVLWLAPNLPDSADCTNTPYFGPIIMPYVADILAGKEVPPHPPKPFITINSITDEGKADAQKLLKEMQDQKMAFAPK